MSTAKKPKHPLLSMTIWGGLITGVSLFLRGAGIDLPVVLEADIQELARFLVDAAGVALVIWGRYRASAPMGPLLGKKPPAAAAGLVLAVVALPLLLAGCGGMMMAEEARPRTLKERVFASGHELRGLLGTAADYVERPVCMPPLTVGCADPDVKATIKQIAAQLRPTLRSVLAAARAEPDPNAPHLAETLKFLSSMLIQVAAVLERAGIEAKERKTSWIHSSPPPSSTASPPSRRPGAITWLPPPAPRRYCSRRTGKAAPSPPPISPSWSSILRPS